jgi:hypothetical protein
VWRARTKEIAVSGWIFVGGHDGQRMMSGMLDFVRVYDFLFCWMGVLYYLHSDRTEPIEIKCSKPTSEG